MIEQLIELHSNDDLATVWKTSTEKPVFLFKQSTTCPISAEAFEEFQSFLEKTDEDVGAYFVKVRETREVSNEIADHTGIQHQSPQVMLVKDQEVLWNASHNKINVDSLEDALKKYE